MASSTQRSGPVHEAGGRDEFCVKCEKKTVVWKSRSNKNPGRKYNWCDVYNFSHWYEDARQHEDEDEAESSVQDTSMLLNNLI